MSVVVLESEPVTVNEGLSEGDQRAWDRLTNDNIWELLQDVEEVKHRREERKIEYQDDIPSRLPKTHKGRVIDVFDRFAERIFNPDRMTLATYLRMLKDSQIAGIIKVILNATIRGYRFHGGDDRVREFIENMFKNLEGESFTNVLEDALSAIWVGYSVTEKVFDQDADGFWFVKRLQTLPPRGITFVMKDNGVITHIEQDATHIGTDRFNRWLPKSIAVMTYDGGLTDKFGNPYGHSALISIYKDWFSKEHLVRYQNRQLELMAGGLVIAQADLGDAEKLHAKVKRAKSSSVITIRRGQEIKVERPTSSGSAFMESIRYHDIQMAKALLVPSLLLGQDGDFGSRSLSDVYFELFRIVAVKRFQEMAVDWTDRIVRQIVDINFGKQEKYPKLIFNLWTQRERDVLATFFFKLASTRLIDTEDRAWAREQIEVPGDGGEGEDLIPDRGDTTDPGGPAAGSNRRGGQGSSPEMDLPSPSLESILQKVLNGIQN